MSGLLTRLGEIGPARTIMLAIGVAAVFVAFFPGAVGQYSVDAVDPDHILESPSAEHWMGTDEAGADVFARVAQATRLDLFIAVGSVALALVVGLPSGLLAGYRGGVLDELLTGLSSAILSFPIVLFAVLVVASWGASVTTLIIVLAFLFLPRVHMLARAQAQTLKERQFVVAARALGVGSSTIMIRHILPNTVGPLSVQVPQLMAIAILTEAGLSYVGLGIQPPDVTWGTLLQTSKDYYVQAPWYAISVGGVVTIASALLLFAGDLASQSANPLRRRRRLASRVEPDDSQPVVPVIGLGEVAR